MSASSRFFLTGRLMARCLGLVCLVLFLVGGPLPGAAFAEPKKGDAFPDLKLTGPITPQDRTYLGVSETTAMPFALSAATGEAFMIEFFSMYCPYCQREAANLAQLHKELQASPQRDKIRMIGVGINNSDFEVEFFRKKYESPFPLFSDPDGVILKQVGITATPTFVVVKREKGGFKVIKTHVGQIQDRAAFMKDMISAAGM